MPAMSTLGDWLFHVWWRFEPPADAFDLAYRWLNLVEGCFWLVFAGLVLHRWSRHRRSGLELAYAATFAAFGFSDFIEAYLLTTWLIAFKGLLLALLVALRRVVIARCYPSSRLY